MFLYFIATAVRGSPHNDGECNEAKVEGHGIGFGSAHLVATVSF